MEFKFCYSDLLQIHSRLDYLLVMAATRKRTKVYLLGQPLDSFGDRLLPTGKDILRRIASLGANSHANRKKVVDEVLKLWLKHASQQWRLELSLQRSLDTSTSIKN